MAVKNICDGVSAPMQHTMFLGCSVMSFTANMGFNEQGTSVTVNLVEDTCEGNKTYYNSTLESGTWTAADPGFLGLNYNIIGCPVYFRVGEFEFCGLVQSWDEMKNDSAYPTYQVQLSDPRLILEGAQCILNDFGGYVGDTTIFGANYGPYNIFNVYGFMESLGVACPQYSLNLINGYVEGNSLPDGATFGADAGAYGGSLTNNNGISWGAIYTGINVLCNSTPSYSNRFSPFGRIVFRGVNYTNGHGLIDNDIADVFSFDAGHNGVLNTYYVDISEIPAPPSNWRINDTTMSIMDIISTLCEDMGFDYYIELVPVVVSTTIHKFIKVRIHDRSASPSYGKIDEYYVAHPEAIDITRGKELRNEPTSAIVIGGNKQTVYQMYQDNDPEGNGDDDPNNPYRDDTILPYFGLDWYGRNITPNWNSTSGWYIYADTNKLNGQLQYFSFGSGVYIEELELRAALEGMNEWMTVCTALGTDCGKVFDSEVFGKWDYKHIITMIDSMSQGATAARDWIKTNKDAIISSTLSNVTYSYIEEDISTIYNWVNGFAQHYGKDFTVRVPFTCGRIDNDNYQILYSEEPSDGGWTEQTTVLDATTDGVIVDYFRLPDNRIGNFARFYQADVLDIKALGDSKYILWTYNDIEYLFVEISADPKYVFDSFIPLSYPRIVITLPSTIRIKQQILDSQVYMESYGLLISIIDRALSNEPEKAQDAINKLKNAIGKTGGRALMAPLGFPLQLPDCAAIGIKSNVLSYGPWIYSGPAGKVRVDKDDGLVPWEYGSVATMNIVGAGKAEAAITYMQVGEKGQISVPGYPKIPLGAEIMAVDEGYNYHLVENRSLSNTSYGAYTCNYTNMKMGGYVWQGTYGPSVTDISINYGEGGVKTDYSMRTFTPKFGRFEKYNAERLKKFGRDRMQLTRSIRMNWLVNKAKREFEQNNRQIIGGGSGWKKFSITNSGKNSGKDGGSNSWSTNLKETAAGEILVGTKIPRGVSGDLGKRDIVGVETVASIDHYYKNLVGNVGTSFSGTAMMSWDGLIRPISLGGDGGLPRFATTATSGVQEYTSTPPILSKTGLVIGELQFEQQTGVPIYQYTLNPFANPSGYSWSTLSNYADGFVGHDIDIIGRGIGYSDGVGTSGLPMTWSKPGVGVSSGEADYANDYRMFALRGPLVIQGWGYTTDGYPIPNKGDTVDNASRGIFANSGISRFMDGWLQKSDTWPVGPVDLRWDNTKKLWVSPPNTYQLITHTLTGNMVQNEEYWAVTSSGYSNGYYYENGINVKAPLYDVPSGTTILARYDGTSCYNIVDTNRYPQRFALAVLSGVLDYRDSTYATIQVGDVDDLDEVVQVHDWFLHPGESLVQSTRVSIAAFYDRSLNITGWYVIQASCDPY